MICRLSLGYLVHDVGIVRGGTKLLLLGGTESDREIRSEARHLVTLWSGLQLANNINITTCKLEKFSEHQIIQDEVF